MDRSTAEAGDVITIRETFRMKKGDDVMKQYLGPPAAIAACAELPFVHGEPDSSTEEPKRLKRNNQTGRQS
jgi:hypothetical protein